MAGMNKTRTLLFGITVAVAMLVGGVIGAPGLVKSPVTAANAALTAATPTPTPAFKSNEAAAHETGETAAREAAENSGTRPAGPAGAGGGGDPGTPPRGAGRCPRHRSLERGRGARSRRAGGQGGH